MSRLLLLVIVIGSLGAARADDAPSGSEDEPASPAAFRTLGGHRFLVPSAVDGPFVTSHFALRQGVGYLTISDLEVEGYSETVDLALAGALETFEFSARLHPRVGLVGEVTGQLVSGVNADTAFFMGARAGLLWEGGVQLVLVRAEQTGNQLGLRVLGRGRTGYLLEPSSLVSSLLGEREETLADVLDGDYLKYMLSRENGASGVVGLGYAHTFTEHNGIQLSVSVGWGGVKRTWYDGEADASVSLSRWIVGVGAAFEGDGAPRVPLAYQLEYRYRFDVEGWAETDVGAVPASRHTIVGGLFYSGRDDLQLGLRVSGVLSHSEVSGENLIGGEIVIRYFFR